jgi:hypothetical protein
MRKFYYINLVAFIVCIASSIDLYEKDIKNESAIMFIISIANLLIFIKQRKKNT